MILTISKLITNCVLFYLILSSSRVSSQNNCVVNQTPVDIYYPNSVTANTAVTGAEYLCGPNTLLYDTVVTGCHFVYVNPTSTLVVKYGFCNAASIVWLKNNGTLIVLNGSVPFQLISEPLAIVSNTSGVSIPTATCGSITFPSVNCSATGIIKYGLQKSQVSVFPNPGGKELFISFGSTTLNGPVKLVITNNGGRVVEQSDEFIANGLLKRKMNLENGLYLITLQLSDGTVYTNKLSINN